MKKRWFVFTVVVLVTSIILVAVLNYIHRDRKEYVDMVPFAEMEYSRIDKESLYSKMDEAVNYAKNGDTSKTKELLADIYRQYALADSMETLADIRYCQDMTDEYYAAEYEYSVDTVSEIEHKLEEMMASIAKTKIASDLEKEYLGQGYFDDYADYDADASGEIAELLSRENELIARFRRQVGSREFEYDGQILPYDALIGGEIGEEDYDAAEAEYYRKYNPVLGQTYTELVKVRLELAEALGFDSFDEYAYEFIHDRDYSPEAIESYTVQVIEHLVPIYHEAADSELWSKYAYYETDKEDMTAFLESVTEKLGGDAKDAYKFMIDYDLYDIEQSANKMDISFQTYIKEYEAPFLFIKPQGYSMDLLSFSHEFGHYIDSFVNYNMHSSTDVAEVFSQGLEYLSLLYGEAEDEVMESIMGIKMLDSLQVYIEQTAMTRFEHMVYSLSPDEVTLEKINDTFCDVMKEFGIYSEEYDEYYRLSWIDVEHLFEYPFYMISYVVSNDAAMQIFELEKEKAGTGVNTYEKLLDREKDETFLQMLERAGMRSPFDKGRILDVRDDFSDFFELNEADEQAA